MRDRGEASLPASAARWLVIVNPASGRPDGGRGWRAIEQALQMAGVSLDVVHTQHPATVKRWPARRCTTGSGTSSPSAAMGP